MTNTETSSVKQYLSYKVIELLCTLDYITNVMDFSKIIEKENKEPFYSIKASLTKH